MTVKVTSGFGARTSLPALLLAGTILFSGYVTPAVAQVAGIAPVRIEPDVNGVDLLTGEIAAPLASVSIGDPATGGMVYSEAWANNALQDNVSTYAFIDPSGSGGVILEGGTEKNFNGPSFPLTSQNGDGETITDNGNGTYSHRKANGVVRVIGYPDPTTFVMRVLSISTPDGKASQYHYKVYPGQYGGNERIQSITNNFGYQMKFGYAADTIVSNDFQAYFDYATPTSVTLINNAFDYCAPMADACPSLTQNWPKLTFSQSAGVRLYTDSLSRTTQVTYDSYRLTGIRRPGSTSNDLSVAYDANDRVTSVTNAGLTNAYAWSEPSGTADRIAVRSGPLGTERTTVADKNNAVLKSSTDALGRTTTYIHDAAGRQTGIILPEGNSVQHIYDARGNVTQTTFVAKPGSGLGNIVLLAGFDATCVDVVKCNKPNWTRDALGRQTDYSYDATSGQLLTVTLPAPISGGIRPQTRYGYAHRQAFYKNSAGSIVASGQNVRLLVSTSVCRTSSSCAGSADETKSSVDYGPQNAGVANNLRPVAITQASGDNALSVTTGIGYDAVGNVTSVDGPLPGSADTLVRFYDVARQEIGSIGPDPDGGGPLINRAQRLTYNAKGQVTKVEDGTTNGQNAAAFASFATAQQVVTSYDGNGRTISETSQAGGINFALTQYSYDSKGRLDCIAVRMNVSAYGALPGACSLSVLDASVGPDRITKRIYDVADQLIKIQSAFGTADQTDDVTATYNGNGTTATVADGLGNLTTYVYDGLDRLSQTRFPIAGNGAISSTTDYEQLSYDANGNVTQRRLRDGNTISFNYDNLNRPTARIENGTLARQYGYDLLGRLTTVNAFYSGWNSSETKAYDALGRMVQNNAGWDNFSYQYDAAGNRTRVTWADGFFATYDYNAAGQVVAIRENGAASGAGVLASYSYDNLGRRTSMTRGNGTASTYAYDPVSRLSCLTIDVAGGGALNCAPTASGSDQALSFTYNPAGQIISSTRANDAYAWTGHYNVDRPYTVNGLNQLTTAGSTALGYDGRGNLTSSGGTSYTYDLVNRLTSASGALPYLEYGAMDALQGYNTPSGSYPRWANDGANLASEFMYVPTGSYRTRRYVYAPGETGPIVWYEGSGTADRRFLAADERGSIVNVSDSAGNSMAINRYDEYGIPQTGNLGRFQYTGQAWIAELGMYHYKARTYSPTLGRFLQTDPIGYADGMNMYNYVGSDPVNSVDPSGMAEQVCTETTSGGYDCVTEGGRDACSWLVGCSSFSFDGFGNAGYFIFVGGGGVGGSGDLISITSNFRWVPTGGPSAREFMEGLSFQLSGVGYWNGLGGSGGAAPTPQSGQTPLCPPSSNSIAGTIADYADKFGLAADGVTVGALAFGLATAPTGAGPVGAGIVAAGAKAAGSIANLVGGVANIVDGNFVGAAGNALAVFAGNGAGHLATSALTRGRMFGNLTAQGERVVAGVNSGTSFGVQVGMKIGCRGR